LINAVGAVKYLMKASAAFGTIRRQKSGKLGVGNAQDVADLLHGEFGFALRDRFGAAGLHLTFGLIDDIHRLEQAEEG
jgi:hypothetical protein